MPKPNIFNFDTGSSWDPDVSASVSLTPELSESIRLLNKTIENYVGVDHQMGNTMVELKSDTELDVNTPIFRMNVDGAPPIVGHQAIRIMDIYQDGELLYYWNGVAPSNHENHVQKDKALLNIKNKIWTNGNATSSNVINIWDVASGSLGIVSKSIFFVGTPNTLNTPNEKPIPMVGVGTNIPSASLHISSSISGSMTDLIRVQNDFGVPIFKVKPDRIILRNSGSSANEVTMSVDSQNNLMFNDSFGINHDHAFIKSGSKKVRMEVGATSGNLRFKRLNTGSPTSLNMNVIVGPGHTVNDAESSAILSGKNHTISESTDATISAGSSNVIQGSGDSAIGGGHLNKIILDPAMQENMYNYIAGGQMNEITGSGVDRCFIGGGGGNQIYASVGGAQDISSILGGSANKIKESVGACILGGYNNQINNGGGSTSAGNQFIVGGSQNIIEDSAAMGGGILGGYSNKISASSTWPLIGVGAMNVKVPP